MRNNVLNAEITSLKSSTNRWFFILIVGISALVFINIFEPFGIYSTTKVATIDIFIEISLGVLIAEILLIVSQFGLRKLFRVETFTLLSLIAWYALESLIIGTSWFLADYYTAENANWIESVFAYFFLMLIPYFGAVALLIYKTKNKENAALLSQINSEKPNEGSLVVFKDENQIEKLVLQLGQLLYIESSDNYVTIHYKNDSGLKNVMLRNSIKKLEETLQSYRIIRCHRSFMVNTMNILSGIKKQNGLELELKGLNKHTIPVSKTYLSEIKKYIFP